jgi:hypothetical protein
MYNATCQVTTHSSLLTLLPSLLYTCCEPNTARSGGILTTGETWTVYCGTPGQGLSWENQYKWDPCAMMQLQVHFLDVQRDKCGAKYLPYKTNNYHVYHYDSPLCTLTDYISPSHNSNHETYQLVHKFLLTWAPSSCKPIIVPGIFCWLFYLY